MTKKISRRKFLKVMGTSGAIGASFALGGCATQPAGGKGWLPNQYNVPASWSVQVKGRIPIAEDNPSIERDDRKCVLCGQCLEVCRNVMSVYGHYELPLKKEIVCVNCGQCSMWCPTGAITERKAVAETLAALQDKGVHVVVQAAPALKVSLGEEFGLPPGSQVDGKLAAALRRLGFDGVFDTSFAADLTVLEEASELLQRLKEQGGKVPQFTSCCSGWVKFAEYYYPELLPNLSSCKSPQQMLGRVAKTYYAAQKRISPQQIVVVAVMPCTAKKFEAARQDGELRDVDIVITTRELAELLKKKDIDLNALPEEGYDSLLGERSGAGVIFGATGGVTEAALRTAYHLAGGQEPPQELLDWQAVRGLPGVKEAEVNLPGHGALRVAVCHGLKNARPLLDKVRKKQGRWQFVEVMACPGGCIGGGGQPRTALPPTDEIRRERIAGLYGLDAALMQKRCSHQNQEVRAVYENWLGKPLSEAAEKNLHTSFIDRSGELTAKA